MKKNDFLSNLFLGKQVSKEKMMELGWVDQCNDLDKAFFGIPNTEGLWAKALRPVAPVPYQLIIYVLVYITNDITIRKLDIQVVDLDYQEGGKKLNVAVFQHDLANIAIEIDHILIDGMDREKATIGLKEIISSLGKLIEIHEGFISYFQFKLEDKKSPAPDYPSPGDFKDQTHLSDDLYTYSAIAYKNRIVGVVVGNFSYIKILLSDNQFLPTSRHELISLIPGYRRDMSNILFDLFDVLVYSFVVECFSDQKTVKKLAVLDSRIYH